MRSFSTFWKYCVSVLFIGFTGLCHVGVVYLLYIHFRYISKYCINGFHILGGAQLPWHPMFNNRVGRVEGILRHSVQLFLEPTYNPASVHSQQAISCTVTTRTVFVKPTFALPPVSMLSVVACVELSVAFTVLYGLDIVPLIGRFCYVLAIITFGRVGCGGVGLSYACSA